MELQKRIEVQGAVQQWVDSFMLQYNISASMMEDALNKVLNNLKDKVVIELLMASQEVEPIEKVVEQSKQEEEE